VQQEVQKEIDKAEGKSWPMVSVERYAFYERAKGAYCVIQTGERRFYGCFTLTKGVIPPDIRDRARAVVGRETVFAKGTSWPGSWKPRVGWTTRRGRAGSITWPGERRTRSRPRWAFSRMRHSGSFRWPLQSA